MGYGTLSIRNSTFNFFYHLIVNIFCTNKIRPVNSSGFFLIKGTSIKHDYKENACILIAVSSKVVYFRLA